MSEKLNDQHLNTWRRFITAHAKLIDSINREMLEADVIPLHWYDVLIELYEAPERRLRLSELARKVVLSKSGLTRLVDKLAEAGLLARQSSPEDGRGAYAVLTDAGLAAMRKAWPLYANGIQTYFAQHMSLEEAEIMAALFERMLQHDSKPS
jgi:DNA-binding MarR family transcriptional regulator